MIEITVSNDNFATLLGAKNGEEIAIGHKHTSEVVLLTKVRNTTKPKKLTLSQIEQLLGFPVEIVSE